MNVNFELSPAARAEAHRRYSDHILVSTDRGQAQLEKGSEIPFSSWSYKVVRNFLQISLDLTPDSLQDFNDGIVGPYRKLIEKIRGAGHAIDIALAGDRTLNGHSTYFRADFSKSPAGSLERAFNNLGTDPGMEALLNTLYRAEIVADAFVPGFSSYACTDKPSDLVVAGREYAGTKTIEYAPSNSGVLVVPYDLIHWVVGIAGIVSPEAGKRLAEGGREISANLKNHPVRLKIGRVMFGTAAMHIGTQNENLLK